MKNLVTQAFLLVRIVGCLTAVAGFAQGCGASEDGSSSDGGAGGAAAASSGVGASSGAGNPGINVGGASSSGSGGLGTGGTDCGGEQVDAEPVDVNLLFVIDRSESMQTTPEGFNASKWDSMVGSLKASLDGIRGKMAVGLQFFPDPPAGAADELCGMPEDSALTVAIDASDVTAPLIEAELDGSAPTGSTPAADALALVREYFAAEGSALPGQKYVLLALDGGPNCNAALSCGDDTSEDRALCTQTYDKPESCGASAPFNCCSAQPEGCLDANRVAGEVEALREAGIVTIVVGIPGSEPYAEVLDALAEAGGAPASERSPKYFKVEDPETLTAALTSLSMDLIKSCELELETEPPDPEAVNVYLDDEVVPKSGDDGWELDSSTTPAMIRIKGATCEELERTGARSIRVEFGCPTIYVPR